MSNDIILWQAENGDIIPKSAKTPAVISEYAIQLSSRDKKQIVAAFDSGHYEIGITYLWGKTITALKKELSTVGVALLGEMLGKTDVDEDDNIEDILTTKDSIRLAEELGIVSPTDAMRLRHTHELVTHFSQMEASDDVFEEIDESEAMSSLKACVKSVLGRPRVEVAKKFVEFREALEDESLSEHDSRVELLKTSPYFFHKLTVSVLMNAAKKKVGATLEHVLANINVLIPIIWANLRETERWQVGYTYAEAFAEGKSTTVAGVKSALLKVQGFDYVPENLRSDTFRKAAEAIIAAHEGFNNFYNEAAPVKSLSKLGTTIPVPALPICITALLCVVLGNRYGVSHAAWGEAFSILDGLSNDRWTYYVNNVLPSDIKILNKLSDLRPASNWVTVVNRYKLADVEIKNKGVNQLMRATLANDHSKITSAQMKLIQEFYGR